MGLPTLTDSQMKGVREIADWYRSYDPSRPDFRLAGFAGTGKSTMLPTIVDHLGLDIEDIAFCAPTGKASKVMATKLKDFDIVTRTRTIHSLIYTPKRQRAEVLEQRLTGLKGQRDTLLSRDPSETTTVMSDDGGFRDLTIKERIAEIEKEIAVTDRELDKAYDDTDGPSFMLNPESDLLKKKLAIIDEGSMVGESIADDLRSFGIPLLVMGDPGQLPPVGEPPGFDLEDPDVFLSEVHRQAKDNPIIWLATLAREGKPLPRGVHGTDVQVIGRARDDKTTNPDLDAQVIVGTHVKRWNVTKAIRKALGYTSTGPIAGEPLIVCKNSRNIPELVNGSFVSCVDDVGDLISGDAYFSIHIEDEAGVKRRVLAAQSLFEEHHLRQKGAATARKQDAFRARIEREHLDWGWAITCHKSQGSQWDEVVVHDESGMFRDDAARWLYTAVTRAAKRLTVVV
ncbi:ATP-dependent RecD-like DNA helicase [Microcystis phage Mwe-JY26]